MKLILPNGLYLVEEEDGHNIIFKEDLTSFRDYCLNCKIEVFYSHIYEGFVYYRDTPYSCKEYKLLTLIG